MNKIKKFLIGSAMGALLFGSLAGAGLAKVDRVAGPWELNAPSAISFVCNGGTYNHTLDTVYGNFTGTGHYDANSSYTWDINGSIVGDNVSYTIVYTGTGAGTTYNGVGTIAYDGSISGTVDGNCQTFSMGAGSASRFTGNHGQYVSSQEDKSAAARSRVGMPVQSYGHTQ